MLYLYKKETLLVGKELRCVLRNIYGFGWFKSIVACSKIGVSYPYFVDNLNLYNFSLLSCILDSLYWIDVQISRFIYFRILRYVDIRSYRGLRFISGLPVRGQRTHSNAKTCKVINKLKYKL